MDVLFSFDDWQFDPASGELRRSNGETVRIQPQPAQLLTLLLKHAGEVVTREDIIQSVWPDTTVEFDQAVNYNIRHLRSALGESAENTRYIETFPRRGYRFIQPVTTSPTKGRPKTLPFRPASSLAVIAVVGAVVLGFWGLGKTAGEETTGTQPSTTAGTIGIMMLRHAEEDSIAARKAMSIAEQLTAQLTQVAWNDMRIVGPTSTTRFRSQPNVVESLRIEGGIDYLLSGRVTLNEQNGLYLELLRTSDGAHLWAMTAEVDDPRAINSAVDSVIARLK